MLQDLFQVRLMCAGHVPLVQVRQLPVKLLDEGMLLKQKHRLMKWLDPCGRPGLSSHTTEHGRAIN